MQRKRNASYRAPWLGRNIFLFLLTVSVLAIAAIIIMAFNGIIDY